MSSLSSTSKRSWGVGLRKAAQLVCGAMAVLLLCLPLFSQGNAGRILEPSLTKRRHRSRRHGNCHRHG